MKFRLPLFLICSFVLLMGCKKHSDSGSECVETLKGTISLTPEEKLIHPYGLNDSLVFVNDGLKDTVSFTCTIQASYFQNQSENSPDLQGNIACLGNYYNIEQCVTRFNMTSTKDIYIMECGSSPLYSIYPDKQIHFSIRIPWGEIAPFDGVYGFLQDTLFTDPNHSAYASIGQYYDTLTIREKSYSKVYLLKGPQGPYGMDKITQVWYSVSDGIIRFSTKYGMVWELKERVIGHP